mgnify:CR=1 FL=1
MSELNFVNAKATFSGTIKGTMSFTQAVRLHPID